jgi:hypothetical protein
MPSRQGPGHVHDKKDLKKIFSLQKHIQRGWKVVSLNIKICSKFKILIE